jgi:muconate cycloisomerase
MIVEDIVRAPIRYERGEILVPHGPGLGVELDEAQVKRFKR